jgi:hypothetical protein
MQSGDRDTIIHELAHFFSINYSWLFYYIPPRMLVKSHFFIPAYAGIVHVKQIVDRIGI